MSRITRFILTMVVISLVGFVDMFAAVAPSSQARYISFTDVTATSVKLTLVKGNGNKRLVVFSADGTVDSPDDSDDALNDANGNFGTAVSVNSPSPDIVVDVLSGSEWFTTVTGLTAGVTYKVKVFEFNSDNSTFKNAYYTADGTNNPRSFTTAAGPVEPPNTLTVNALTLSATTADLSWADGNSSSDGFIFTLWVDQDGEGNGGGTYEENSATVAPYVELDLGYTLSFDLTDLVGPSDYKYEVSSYIGNDESVSAYGYFYTPSDATHPTVQLIELTGQTGLGGAIYEGDAGNNVNLTVTFDEAMKTWQTPTFAFSATSDLTYVTGSWNPAGKVFTASFLVGDTDQEHDDVDVTITGVEDLAGNTVDDGGNNVALAVFSIDNKDGVFSGYDYATAGNYNPQPVCKSAVKNSPDDIQIEITVTETGFEPLNSTLIVVAQDAGLLDNPLEFTSTPLINGPGTYLFTYQLTNTETADDYNIIIEFTDGAGNINTDLSHTGAFRIENTPPVISNASVSADCEKGGNTVTLTFDVAEAGCGTFDKDDIIITDNVATATNTWAWVSGDGVGTYTYELPLVSGDPSGQVTVSINASDDAGNDATEVQTTFTIDNTIPTIGNVALDKSCVNNGTLITLTFDVTDPVSAQCGALGLAVASAYTAGLREITSQFTSPNSPVVNGDVTTFTYTMEVLEEVADALFTINILAEDNAGNVSATNTDASFTTDNTDPVISALSVTPGCRKSGSAVTISFTVTESGCGTFDENNVSITGLPSGDGTLSSALITGNAPGPYNFEYTYQIGNSDLEGTYTVLVDATDDATNNAIQAGGVTLSDFTIDNTAPLFENFTVTGLDGSCLKVGSTLEFTVDVVEAGCGTFDETDFTIGITPQPTNSLVPDGGNPASGTGTYKFTLVLHADDTQGAYNFTFDGTDVAGNAAVQYAPVGTEFTLDKTAPQFNNVVLDASCVKGGTTVTLTFDVTEAGCGTFDKNDITITDDVTTATNTWAWVSGSGVGPYTYTLPIVVGDPTGLVTLAINANDDAGNAATTATPSFSIDNAGPTLSALVVTPPAAGGTTTQVVIGFTAVSNGCSPFDASTVVYTFTGPGTIAGVVNLGTPVLNGGKWEVTLQIANTDVTGNYHISIAAADGLGNPSNTLAPLGVELVIDNTPPQVASVTASKALLNRADDNNTPPEFYIDVTYNEALNTAIIPTLTFNPGLDPTAPVAALTATTSVSTSSTKFRYSFNLDKNTNLDMRSIGVKINGARDVAGNDQIITNTKSNLFGIDFLEPYLQSLTVNNPANGVITDTTTTGLELVFDFSEPMNNTSAPTITFETGSAPNNATLAQLLTTTAFPGISKWNINDVYTAKFTINGTFGLETDDVAVGISNATDLAGNPFPGSNESEVFDVDTREPGCVSITMDPVAPVVIVADLSFDVEVVMDQTLDNTVAPTIAFTNSNANYTISNQAFGQTNVLDDTYTFTVTHNLNQENTTETMSISGFKDTHGNVQVTACTANFDVDTKLPEIVSIAVSDDKICMDDDNDAYTITIVFDEEMGATVPILAFSPDHSVIFSATGGGWSTTTNNNDTYTFTSTLDLSAGVEALVSIDVSGAQDLLGNTMTTDTDSGDDAFSIDTKAPTVTGIAFNPIPSNAFGVNRSNIGTGGFEVAVTYDEAMDGGSTPTIVFTPGITPTGTIAAALTAGTGTWTSTTVYTQTYTVNDAVVDISGITATVTLAEDACGNEQGSYDSGIQQSPITFDIDLIAPTCVSIVADTDPIYEGDLVQGLTVTFSEEMSNTVNPAFNFATSTDFTTAGGNWDQTGTVYTANSTHGNVAEEIAVETVSLNIGTIKPTDLAGNPILVASCSDVFEIDTKKPLVSSVTFTPNKLIGTTTNLDVIITFNEAMNISVSPSIAFSAGSGALSADGSSWNGDSTVYTANYDVSDIDFEGTGITVDITDAMDKAGNEMSTHTSTETLAIDQVEPTIVSLSVSDAMINKAEANAELYLFTVTAEFSEAMNTGVNPTVTFSPNVLSGPASLSTGATDWSIDNKSFIHTFFANDHNIAVQDIDITIAGGEDACGNATDYNTNTGVFADKFSIDTENPTVTFDQGTPLVESCVNGTEEVYYVAADGSGFSGISTVKAKIGGGTFTAFADGALLNTVAGWGAASDGAITLELMATDVAGNTTTISRLLNKDTQAPVIGGESFANTCVTTGDVIDIEFTITETGCGTIIADNITASGFPAGNGVLSAPTITGNAPYVVTATYTVGSTDAQGIYNITFNVTDDAGNAATPSVNNAAFTIDKTAPNFTYTPVATVCANNTDIVNFSFNSVDAGGCGSYGIGNISASTSLGSAVVTSFGSGDYGISVNLSGTNSGNDGTYNIAIVMTDPAGNVNNQTITNAFTIDNTAPAVTFQDPEGGETVNATKVLNFIATDGGCGIASTQVSVDNTNWTAATTGITDLGDISEFAGLGEGAFTLYIKSTDTPGNLGTSSVALVKDATAPTVTSVLASDPMITIADNGNAFTVAVNFSEGMDQTVNPTVALTANGTVTNSTTSGTWTTSTKFTATFGNINGSSNQEIANLSVTVSGAKDDTEDIGNAMALQTLTNAFSIDTKAPTISVASIKSNNIINDQYARVGNDIKITISPSEALTTFTGNIAGYTGLSVSNLYGINGTYVLTVSTDPGVAAGLVTFSINYKDLNGNAGATLTSVTDASSVTVDKVAPVGTIALANLQADPTSDSPINFALTFSESVFGLTNGDITVSGGAGATTAVVTGSGATYNVAVSGMTGGGTVVITLASAKVTDIAGNDNTATTNTDNSVLYNVSGATEVAAGAGVEPATISSLVDSEGNSVIVFDFDVTDDGDVPGADGLATLITDISVSQGAGDDFGDWTTVLAGAKLTDGTHSVSASSINASSIVFSGLDFNIGEIGHIADNAVKTYSLKIWLSDSQIDEIDNLNLAFKVNRSSFTVSGGGSTFASGAGADVESGATNNAIDVQSTELVFTTTPAYTAVNEDTEFVIEALDANGNRDVNYGSYTINLSPDKSSITSGGSGTISNGIATFSYVVFADTARSVTITASDNGPLADVESSTFNIKFEEPLAISHLSIATNKFEFDLTFTNPSGKNTLILAKKDVSTYSYSDESGMDGETGWVTNSSYGSSQTPDDNTAFVIYSGSGSSVKMLNLEKGKKEYAVTAYAFAGDLNSVLQNFNENGNSTSALTWRKDVDYSETIIKGLSLGIDNITPQPANLNNVVSLQVETIEDMPLTLELYDSKGQKMMTLFEGRDFTSGETPFEFNLTNTISSGQHFLRLTGNGHVVIAPLMIVK